MNTIQSARAVRAKVSHGCTTRFWLVAFTAVMVFCCSAMGQNEDILGRWDPPEQCAGYDPYEWDHYAFSAIHLPSNEVLHWRTNGVTNRVWTASTGCFTDVATPYSLSAPGTLPCQMDRSSSRVEVVPVGVSNRWRSTNSAVQP